MKKILISLLLLLFTAAASRGAETGVCRVITVTGVIDPVVADYVSDELSQKNFDVAVIALNTPGGLMDSMQDIVRAMMNCSRPVCVWIGPSGSRAASAGVFITVAADFAAMAPATNIGAAHPVQMSLFGFGKEKSKDKGKDIMMEKVVNDAVAYIQSIAKEKGRPLEWVKNAVEKSVSIDARAAQKEGIVDFISPDINDFLKKIDGKEINKGGKKIILNTRAIAVVYEDMPPVKNFLHAIANPNMTFILLIIGVLGIIHETSSPGVGFGGAIGGISLLLAFFSMKVLPINTVGLLLIVLGFVLLFLELFTPTFGVLMTGGLTSLVLGGMMLIDRTRMDIGVSLSTILPSVVLLALFMIFVVWAVIKSQKRKVSTGIEGLIGAEGTAEEDISDGGFVLVQGELWKASSIAPLKKAAKVRVTAVKGNSVVVEEIKEGDNG